MAKKFKITETQYKQMIDEGVAPTINLPLKNGNIDTSATENIKSQFNGKNYTFTAKPEDVGSSSTTTTPATTNESRIITKKQLQANRLRYLKENSDILSFNNFMKQLH